VAHTLVLLVLHMVLHPCLLSEGQLPPQQFYQQQQQLHHRHQHCCSASSWLLPAPSLHLPLHLQHCLKHVA
jgi:hypothetical protein